MRVLWLRSQIPNLTRFKTLIKALEGVTMFRGYMEHGESASEASKDSREVHTEFYYTFEMSQCKKGIHCR